MLTGGAYGGKQWLLSLLPDKAHFDALKQTQTTDLSYVSENVPENRGKILAVVTSVDQMGKDKTTGYEHTELARAYWVFIANGFEVDFASPKGGKPPVVLDGEDMGAYDYAFLNDITRRWVFSGGLFRVFSRGGFPEKFYWFSWFSIVFNRFLSFLGFLTFLLRNHLLA